MAAYCPTALHSVMATMQPVWNASVLLGRRKGYLCFLHITVTQTCSLKLFCSLDGLHNSLPDLHNNKLKRGHQEKHLLLDKKGLRTPDLDGGTGAQSGRLKRHKNASVQTFRHPVEGRPKPRLTPNSYKCIFLKGLLAEQRLLSMFSITDTQQLYLHQITAGSFWLSTC